MEVCIYRSIQGSALAASNLIWPTNSTALDLAASRLRGCQLSPDSNENIHRSKAGNASRLATQTVRAIFASSQEPLNSSTSRGMYGLHLVFNGVGHRTKASLP